MASIMLRQLPRSARLVAQSSRALSTSATLRKDFVQDLYLKELKAYTPAPAAKDAHVGLVKNISIPEPPQPPALPTDISSEVQAYASSQPTLAEAAAPTTATAEEGAGGAEAFLAFLEQDLPKAEAHH